MVIDDCTIDNHQKIKENFSLKTDKIIIITIGFHNERHNNDDNYIQLALSYGKSDDLYYNTLIFIKFKILDIIKPS